MKKKLRGLVFLLVVLTVFNVQAQTTAFSYQGRLTDGAAAANGTYEMQFSLYDAASGGTQTGSTLTKTNIAVNQGVFTVELDFFPAEPFSSGASRWLEIAVKKPAEPSYTTLAPRQQITSSPYSIRTLSAAQADNSLQLGGLAANQYVQTNDSRLSDNRAPTAGSSNYVQNTTMPQTANFNVSGNGIIGGNLTVTGTLNATFGQNVTSAFGTAGVAVSTSAWSIVPGLTQTIIVPAGTTRLVYISTDGGFQTSAAVGGYSLIDVAIYINSSLFNNAGFRRITATNPVAGAGTFEYWSIGNSITLSPGTYTFDVRTRWVSGSAVTVSGNNSSILQGQLTTIVIKQ